MSVTPAVVVSIGLSPINATCAKGATQQFLATGTYSDGTTADLTPVVAWASSNTGAATISNRAGSQGLATGVGIGTTQITAALDGVTSPADPLTVTAAALSSIALAPLNPSAPKGTTVPFTATGTYTDGTTANLTNQVTWASATPSVAGISPSGLATALSPGMSGITASLGGVTSPADPLTVTAAALSSIALAPLNPSAPKGTTVPFTATGTYTDGTTANLTNQVTWASATPSVAGISPSGLATALSPGTSGITASLGGVTSPSDPMTVTAAALQSIAVTPANPSVPQGQTQQLTATGTYTDGTTANLTPQVTWASSTPAVAPVSPAGLASALTPGNSGITASLNGVTSPTDTLTVPAANVCVTGVAVQWGTETAALVTNADGLRLLPVGRAKDLPWFNINRIDVTLSQAATVSPGDVSLHGVTGGNYGPVSISGSGTSTLVITLAKPIASADKITLTIGNAQVINYTRRLDVLPGDVNDDGAVNSTDGVLILNNPTASHTYQVFDDMNGDGAVGTADFTTYRPKIGTVLPGTWPQLAAGGEGPGGLPRLTQAQLAPALSAAIRSWAAAGLPAREVALLRGARVEITALPAGVLGETALGGTTIELSADAAGYGWYVGGNSTFGRRVAAAEEVAGPTSPAAGHEDLLTVLAHELGHTLGLADLNTAGSDADVMAESLATGVRRLPSARDVALVDAALGSMSVPVASSRATVLESPGGVTLAQPTSPAAASVKHAGEGALALKTSIKYRARAQADGTRRPFHVSY